ncbi:hypothetical protein [Salegentibacter salarius]|uniref:Competence protein n=1 Tax=Salegentibacter salarius TaxID=435906 RepID=A0A2N0TX08_9FLAO|nr:hypothetical protein [Salegentibacter salarius]OEY72823.1 hypothetical protein BHS39_11310 [Salegentibacter salarius]PKD19283.1 hypothetical protein APR40_11290 [Salegentibacter salarius]SLJ99986.1 hypothetical protein SAMN05660445_02309 [Salegentibacter salarius]
MSQQNKEKEKEKDNDWARNIQGVDKYISQVDSGRKGYFCIGCQKEMEAVKKRNPRHRSFFRHVAVDVSKGEIPCSFSSREYRENLVKDILQRIKKIKVPALYKFPPKGNQGVPSFLQNAKFLTAAYVRSEVTYYENKNGEIMTGKNPEINDRYLNIRPDVVFYNEKHKPILFIELVVTHKISEEKKIILKRMGIDTVQFIVPRTKGSEIEESLKTTKHTKWIYNELEANTPYSQLSSSDAERLPFFDEQQRKLFEESYKCRATQISNLIRSITRNLESQQYLSTQRRFNSEISRVSKATKEAEQRLEQMERTAKEEVYSEFKGRFREIEEEISAVERETTICEELLQNPLPETDLQQAVNREERETTDLDKRAGEVREANEKFAEYAAHAERILEEEFGQISESTIRKIAAGTLEPTPGMLPGIKSILEAWGFLSNHYEARQNYKRYRAYQNFIRGGTWKEW